MNAAEKDPLTGAVIAAAIEVHRIMGPGLLESIYQVCLQRELILRSIDCKPQYRFPVVYKGEEVSDPLIIDIFFPSKLVIELKAVEKLLPVHDAQLLTYMKLTQTPVGLLLNFNVPVLKDGVRRMVL